MIYVIVYVSKANGLRRIRKLLKTKKLNSNINEAAAPHSVDPSINVLSSTTFSHIQRIKEQHNYYFEHVKKKKNIFIKHSSEINF